MTIEFASFGILICILLTNVFGLIKLLVIFKEFPPHRHVDEQIVYPMGMKPPEGG
jgi:hypothetical protein